jgi:anti-sigma-K factor RskA
MNVEEPRPDPDGCGGNAAPYVLGALTDDEHRAFRRHMESCAVCREEVAALQLVAAALPASAPQLKAPPELKRRVMSSVREDASRRAAESPPAARTRSAERWRWRPALAVGAVALAAVVLAAVALVSGSASSGGGTRVIRAQVLPAHASAWLSVSGGHAQLTIAHMPQTAPGHVYQMWIKRSGGPLPTDTLFTVAASGAATVGVPGSVSGVKEVMVTSEPLGGSPAPTSPVVIVARLS